jgi:hypothetical protein
MRKEPFADISNHLRFYYFLDLIRADSKLRISNSMNRNFLEFLASTLPENGWRISLSGTRYMHLWTETNDWEMILKLSEQFPDHTQGIKKRATRVVPDLVAAL